MLDKSLNEVSTMSQKIQTQEEEVREYYKTIIEFKDEKTIRESQIAQL